MEQNAVTSTMIHRFFELSNRVVKATYFCSVNTQPRGFENKTLKCFTLADPD